MPSILDRLRNPGFNQGFNQGLYGATADPYANPLLEAIMGGNQGMAQWQEQQLQQQALAEEKRRKDEDRRLKMALMATKTATEVGPELTRTLFGNTGVDLDSILSSIAEQQKVADREKELAAAQELDRVRGIIEGGATGQPDLMGPPTRAIDQKVANTEGMTAAQKSAYLTSFLEPPPPEELPPGTRRSGHVLLPGGRWAKEDQPTATASDLNLQQALTLRAQIRKEVLEDQYFIGADIDEVDREVETRFQARRAAVLGVSPPKPEPPPTPKPGGTLEEIVNQLDSPEAVDAALKEMESQMRASGIPEQGIAAAKEKLLAKVAEKFPSLPPEKKDRLDAWLRSNLPRLLMHGAKAYNSASDIIDPIAESAHGIFDDAKKWTEENFQYTFPKLR